METCHECRKLVILVQDYAAGDTICTECGLVLDEHFVDETPEWRTFYDGVDSSDPDRVGAPSNPLLSDGGLGTMISPPRETSENLVSSSLLLAQIRLASKGDKSLLAAFQLIAAMADRLGLLQTIADRAKEIYKHMQELQYGRGRSKDGIAGACVFIACRQEGTPRTFKEIVAVANEAKLKEIGKATKDIVRYLEKAKPDSVTVSAINAADYARRFCSRLGMAHKEVVAISETIATAKSVVHVHSNPTTVLAAIIFMVSQLSDSKRSMKEVAEAACLAEVTVRASYRELYPSADRIIPKWFADRVNLMALPKL